MADEIDISCVIDTSQQLIYTTVHVSSSESVSSLKRAIKKRKPDLLGHIDTDDIVLHKVSINLHFQFQRLTSSRST